MCIDKHLTREMVKITYLWQLNPLKISHLDGKKIINVKVFLYNIRWNPYYRGVAPYLRVYFFLFLIYIKKTV